MNRGYVIKFGYRTFLTDDPQFAVACLSNLQRVEKERIDDKYIYVPKEDEAVELETINLDTVRPMTPEEKDNKELREAKSSAEWSRKENENLRKQVEELKCQLKVALTKEVSE